VRVMISRRLNRRGRLVRYSFMTEMKWEVHHLTERALGRGRGVGGLTVGGLTAGGLMAGWYSQAFSAPGSGQRKSAPAKRGIADGYDPLPLANC
jgi:hypothetical protein